MDILEQLQQEQKAAEERERLRVSDKLNFEAVIATSDGRRFVRRVLSECGVYRSVAQLDHANLALAEGKRRVGLWLLSLFEDYPDQYVKFLTEKQNDD